MIYHITTQSAWEDAQKNGKYEAESLQKEGFIHMSHEHQIEGVLERYFQGKTALVKLTVDETKIIAEIKNELSPSLQETFPHVYGAINLDAVVDEQYLVMV
jgi:uncharacterized protein (DUF952 family)